MNFSLDKKIFKNNNYFIFLPYNKKVVPVKFKFKVKYEDILFVDRQKELILSNTEKFIKNQNSNNVLLWGASGMGKSTLVRCVVMKTNEKIKNKINMIEIPNNNLELLTEIIYFLSKIDEKFIIFIDDILIKNDNPYFNTLKSLIEGSLLSNTENVRFYITSNLRHISDSQNFINNNNQLLEKEMKSNLISLSDRFALWVGFYDNNKDSYIKTVKYYFKLFKKNNKDDYIKKALEWSLNKGSYSGRTALQFVDNYSKEKLKQLREIFQGINSFFTLSNFKVKLSFSHITSITNHTYNFTFFNNLSFIFNYFI